MKKSQVPVQPRRGRAEADSQLWCPELERRPGVPLFAQVARAIVTDIERGRLRPGERLPGSRTLAAKLGVHRNTVLAAFAELSAGGWIVASRARGSFVCEALPSPLGPRPPSPARPLGISLPRRAPAGLAAAPAYPLSDAAPDLAHFPFGALARAYRRALRSAGASCLGYASPLGHERLRAALVAMLGAKRGLALGPDELMVTRGSQMALDLCAQVLLEPGSVVAVEDPGYPPAWRSFRARGAELLGLPVDAEGVSVEALQRACAKRPVRALYLTPHHQYPTAVTMSAARRLRLLELAQRERLAVIEDDYAHEFHYEGRPLQPLAARDAAGVVLYVGTLSKGFAPGLRLGYLAGPSNFLEHAASLREHCDRQGDTVSELALAELLEEGEVERHTRRMRRLYQARKSALQTALDRHFGSLLVGREPTGGLALWAEADPRVNLDSLQQRAVAAGLGFRSARDYHLDGRPGRGVRLQFASFDELETERNVRTLRTFLS